MSLFLTFLSFFVLVVSLLAEYTSAAAGLLAGVVGIQLINCLLDTKDEELPVDVDRFLSVLIISFGLSSFLDVEYLPVVLPFLYVTLMGIFLGQRSNQA